MKYLLALAFITGLVCSAHADYVVEVVSTDTVRVTETITRTVDKNEEIANLEKVKADIQINIDELLTQIKTRSAIVDSLRAQKDAVQKKIDDIVNAQ